MLDGQQADARVGERDHSTTRFTAISIGTNKLNRDQDLEVPKILGPQLDRGGVQVAGDIDT